MSNTDKRTVDSLIKALRTGNHFDTYEECVFCGALNTFRREDSECEPWCPSRHADLIELYLNHATATEAWRR